MRYRPRFRSSGVGRSRTDLQSYVRNRTDNRDVVLQIRPRPAAPTSAGSDWVFGLVRDDAPDKHVRGPEFDRGAHVVTAPFLIVGADLVWWVLP